MKQFVNRVKKILPNDSDSRETRNLKVTVFLFVTVFTLMVVAGIIAFSLSVKGAEETLVPNIVGKDIISGLVDLQSKELYPKIQVRYSSDYKKGTIIQQIPNPGSTVKAGRQVTLIISKGPIIDKVEDYIGQNIGDVRIHLQTLFASHKALLKIKEDSVMYRFDDKSPPGTILEQKPEPGTPISDVTYLEFVVSRGPRGEYIEIPDYTDMPFQQVILDLAGKNIPFVFTVHDAKNDEGKGIVVSQSPKAKSAVSYGTVVQLEMTKPMVLGKNNVFGVFKHILPDYPIFVDIRLDAVSSEGTRTILKMKHPGGPLSVPYIVPSDAEIVLYIFDREEIRQSALSKQ
ncbi:MAG: PASTA domain-containing protein [Spirochaetales bacterium]|nr:PASTA domain-containing protein [Spirochaetales bacterium]